MVEELLDVVFGPWALVAFAAFTLGPKLLGGGKRNLRANSAAGSVDQNTAPRAETKAAPAEKEEAPIEDLLPKQRKPRARRPAAKRKTSTTRNNRKHHRKAS